LKHFLFISLALAGSQKAFSNGLYSHRHSGKVAGKSLLVSSAYTFCLVPEKVVSICPPAVLMYGLTVI